MMPTVDAGGMELEHKSVVFGTSTPRMSRGRTPHPWDPAPRGP